MSGATPSPLRCHPWDALPPLYKALVGEHASDKGASRSETEGGTGDQSPGPQLKPPGRVFGERRQSAEDRVELGDPQGGQRARGTGKAPAPRACRMLDTGPRSEQKVTTESLEPAQFLAKCLTELGGQDTCLRSRSPGAERPAAGSPAGRSSQQTRGFE